MTEPKRCCDICTRRNRCKYSKDENMIGCAKFKKAKPMTNEEYLRSCNTEQLAEQITDIVWECKEQDDCMDCRLGWCSKDYVVEWLKQSHGGE